MLLNRTRRTIFVEYTFCNSREHIDHRIESLLLRNFRIVQNSPTIRHEFAVKELVHQYHLTDYVDQAESLAHPISDGIQFVSLEDEIQDMLDWNPQGRNNRNTHSQMFQHVVN